MDQAGLQEIGTIGLAVYVLLEIAKQAGFPKRWGGVLSMVLGVIIGAVSFWMLGKPWTAGLVTGFWGAASASGLYSSTKAVFQHPGEQSVQGSEQAQRFEQMVRRLESRMKTLQTATAPLEYPAAVSPTSAVQSPITVGSSSASQPMPSVYTEPASDGIFSLNDDPALRPRG